MSGWHPDAINEEFFTRVGNQNVFLFWQMRLRIGCGTPHQPIITAGFEIQCKGSIFSGNMQGMGDVRGIAIPKSEVWCLFHVNEFVSCIS